MPDDTEPTSSDLSRRSLIKKGVVAGGIVWAAPMLTSATASAASTGTPAPTTSSSSTSMGQPCDCSFCAMVTQPGGGTLYFTCTAADSSGCDCLCKCGGVNRPCAQADPCTVAVNCVPTTQAMCGQ